MAEDHRVLFDLLHLLGLLLDRMPRHLLPGDMIGRLLSINCQSHFVACLLSWVGQCQINSSSSVKEWATVCRTEKMLYLFLLARPCRKKVTGPSGSKTGGLLDQTRGWEFCQWILFSSFSYFPHFLIGSTSHYWNPSNRKKVLLTQLGLRPRNTDDRIDSQMFVLKVEFISFLKKMLKHFWCSFQMFNCSARGSERPSFKPGWRGRQR